MRRLAAGLIGLTAFLLLLAGCTGELNKVSQARSVPEGNVTLGRQLIASFGCGSCHSIPNVAGANGQVGPPLTTFYERASIAGEIPNTVDNLIAWIQNPQAIEPHTDMPNLGVNAVEARNIAAYLYHQPTLADVFSR